MTRLYTVSIRPLTSLVREEGAQDIRAAERSPAEIRAQNTQSQAMTAARSIYGN